MKEKDIQGILQSKLGGKREVKTPVGYIDLLLENEIIEIKEVSDFKSGIGQLLAYNTYAKKERMSLYLFGYNKELNTNDVIEVCKNNNIKVYYLEININIKEL